MTVDLDRKIPIFEPAGYVFANGVRFPSSPVVSADGNTMDAYEKGTFTPGLGFETPGDENIVLSTAEGEYTKIGRMVHVAITVITSTFTHSTASGRLRVTGLPFTAGGSRAWYGGIYYTGWTQSGVGGIVSEIDSGETFFEIRTNRSGTGVGNIGTTEAPSGTQQVIWFDQWYRV